MPSQLLSVLLLCVGASHVTASCAYGTHLQRRQENGAVKVNNFSYKGATGPLNWVSLDPAANAACGTGTTQSPIDMVNGQFTLVPASTLNLNVQDIARTEFENLGTTVEVIAPPGTGSINVNGTAFELKQFHFHHPSEHLDAGTSLALEMHMVFESANREISVVGVYFDPVEGGQAATGTPPPAGAAPPAAAPAPAAAERRHARDTHADKRQVQVINNGQVNPQTANLISQLIAIMTGAGAGAGAGAGGAGQVVANPATGVGAGAGNVLVPGGNAGFVSQQATGGTQLLDTVFASVGAIATPGTKVAVGPLSMAPLIASLNQGNFQNYKGSLTTPPCSEGVNWFVSTQKQTVSLQALAAVQGVISFNSRFPQNTLGQPNVLTLASAAGGGVVAAPVVGNATRARRS